MSSFNKGSFDLEFLNKIVASFFFFFFVMDLLIPNAHLMLLSKTEDIPKNNTDGIFSSLFASNDWRKCL